MKYLLVVVSMLVGCAHLPPPAVVSDGKLLAVPDEPAKCVNYRATNGVCSVIGPVLSVLAGSSGLVLLTENGKPLFIQVSAIAASALAAGAGACSTWTQNAFTEECIPPYNSPVTTTGTIPTGAK